MKEREKKEKHLLVKNEGTRLPGLDSQLPLSWANPVHNSLSESPHLVNGEDSDSSIPGAS